MHPQSVDWWWLKWVVDFTLLMNDNVAHLRLQPYLCVTGDSILQKIAEMFYLLWKETHKIPY